ncbi:MAG: dihydroorotase [Bacteroidota bacterium]
MENVKSTFIKNVRIVDVNSPFHNKKVDIIIEKGIVKQIGKQLSPPKNCLVFDQPELIISPGFFDMQARVGEPGNEMAETFETACRAAEQGGFTDLLVYPSHQPPTCQAAQISYIKQSGQRGIQLHPSGCISDQMKGKQLAELFDMTQAGALAFTDDKNPMSTSMMIKALEYVQSFGALLMVFPLNHQVNPDGLMHEGRTSTSMGTKGLSHLSEYMQIQRDIEILGYTGGRIHFSNVSCAESVDLIRKAKKKGLKVSCGVSAHQLSYLDEDLTTFPTNLKVMPPFRSQKDREALIKGLQDDTIDVIVSDHTPVIIEEKSVEFEFAAFGISSLPTAFNAVFTSLEGDLEIDDIIRKMAQAPRQILGLNSPRIDVQEPARFTLISTAENTQWDKKNWGSKSYNTPFIGETLRGRVVATLIH